MRNTRHNERGCGSCGTSRPKPGGGSRPRPSSPKPKPSVGW